MITIDEMAKADNLIMRVLKVSELSHTIAKTDKGDLNLRLNYEGKAEDYKFTLDAIPMEEKANNNLIELFNGIIYDIPEVENEPIVQAIEELVEQTKPVEEVKPEEVKLPETNGGTN